ncbi:hypothetical protein FACS1894156_8300 [Bacteroidia bacterium]|nr:hypothetical protein FACS1894156_8300 [Bacteroidia bacterium]
MSKVSYLFPRLPDDYERNANTITPLGRIEQFIKWEEPIDNSEYIEQLNKQ